MKLVKQINVWGLSVLVLLSTVFVVRSLPPVELRSVPVVTAEVMDPSLEQFVGAWRTEVARRFPDAVVLLCHGGTFTDGEWLVKAQDYELPAMTADRLLSHFREKFSNRPIILLACNPGHIHLHGHTNCYIALDSVWCVPDRATMVAAPENNLRMDGVMAEDRWASDPGVYGDVFEFVEAN